jgi:enoyl-CoA hydratase/carnithine racemase
MNDQILQSRDGGILTITLNMPEKRNPISDVSVVEQLCDAFMAADQDMSVRCVILTGAGTVFSSGGDLKQMRPQFRSYFQNIVDMMLNQKESIKKFIEICLKKSTKKRALLKGGRTLKKR